MSSPLEGGSKPPEEKKNEDTGKYRILRPLVPSEKLTTGVKKARRFDLLQRASRIALEKGRKMDEVYEELEAAETAAKAAGADSGETPA